MTAWRAAQAKAQFSEVLDRAEAEGPQLVQRRKQRFLVMTEEQASARQSERPHATADARNAWERLRAPKEAWFDLDLTRIPSKARAAKL